MKAKLTPTKQAKEIQHIIDDLLTEVFKKYGVFFAFSEAQVQEQKQPGVKYSYSSDLNMFYNSETPGNLFEEMTAAVDKGIEIDKQQNGKDEIILRELLNYECFYTGNPGDAITKLEDYNYTKEEVLEVFNNNFNRIVEQYG